MAKIFLALAALVAVASAEDFKPLQNPGNKKCITTNVYDGELDTYTLKTGACDGKKVVEFKFAGAGKALKTSDGYCLDAPNNKDGTKLILNECLSKAKGQKWTKVGKNQWKNGQGFCMEKVGSDMVQKKCKTLSKDDKKSKQQWVFFAAPAPPKPAPSDKEIMCSKWQDSFNCPANTDPLTNIKCVGADDYTCVSVCCKKQPQYTCASQQYQCPKGYVLNNQYCGNYGYAPCDFNRCCMPAPPPTTTCDKWNYCNRGYHLKDNAYQIKCATAQGTNLPWCNTDTCCDANAYMCTDYYRHSSCPTTWNKIPDAASIKCDPKLNNDCRDMCCTQPPVQMKCSDWAVSNKCTKTGYSLILNADTTNGSSEGECCSPDTCEKWLVRKDNGQTGNDVCNAGSFPVIADPKVKCYDSDPNTPENDDNVLMCDQAHCCF